MTRHIVLWNLREDLDPAEKQERALAIKTNLEALKDEIDFLKEIHVYLNEIPSSNREIALVADFDSPEDLAAYIVHPAHKRVGSTFVRPYVQDRACLDFEC